MNSSEISITDSIYKLLSDDEDNEDNNNQIQSEQSATDWFIKFKRKLHAFQGLLIASIAAFFFSLFGILNKKASFVTGSEQSAVRYLMQMILMIIVASCNKVNILGPKELRFQLIKRGVCGAISFISFGFSLKFIDPSDTNSLYNTRLVFISILAAVFLKEKLTFIHICCVILTISGVILICQPSFLTIYLIKLKNSTTNSTKIQLETNLTNYIGIALGLVSAVAASCAAIYIKKLSDSNVHYSINVIFSSYIGFPTALIISLFMYFANVRNVDPNDYNTTEKLVWQIFYSLSSAICGCIHQMLVAISNRYEDANKLAIVNTTNLFWSFVLQYLFLHIDANIYGISGSLLISLAVILNIIIKIFRQ